MDIDEIISIAKEQGGAKAEKKKDPAPAPKAEKAKKTQEKKPETAIAEINAEQKAKSSSGDRMALAEAALFLSSKPLMIDEIAKIMGVSSLGYVKESLEKLREKYENGAIQVMSTSNGWQMQVRPEYLGSVAHLAPYADLSEGPKRALALILLKEPMKQSQLIKMQGNKVYAYLKELEKMGLLGREPWGRTKILKLTPEFERYFGEDKEKIRERIKREIESQHAEPAAPVEKEQE